MSNCSSIFELCGNDIFAFTTAIAAILGQNFTAEELATLSSVFSILGDAMALYATQKARCKDNANKGNVNDATQTEK